MVKLPCAKPFLCGESLKEYYHTMIDEERIENVWCPECLYKPIHLSVFDKFDSLEDALFTLALPYGFFEGLLTDAGIISYGTLHKPGAFLKYTSTILIHVIYILGEMLGVLLIRWMKHGTL